ncbi:MAG: hypothetical protein QGF07_00280, partial [Phycisphaerales bacterium]|nr:hypothetical protein [Phycisphaerales bacterium]
MLHSIFTNRLTLTIKLSHLCFIAIILTVLSGCIEDLQDQNNTQASLKQLMSELNAAVMSDNADALRSVISKANRIDSASRKAKALILSTARAKLGRLQWQQAIAD